MTVQPAGNPIVALNRTDERRVADRESRGTPTLDVRDVVLKRGARPVLQGVTFSAWRGQLLALMGVSGTGKTSLLRAVSGLDPIDAGEILVGDIRLQPGRPPRLRDLHRTVSMVFQFHHLFSHMTALQNVWLAPVHVLQEPRAAAEHRARSLLEMLGVGARADALPHELSGGEAQRVAIARALAVDPGVLLMDEPTASLDQARRSDLAATLLQLADQGRTVLIATHDTDFVAVCAHRVIVLDDGRVIREGGPAEVLCDPV
jgi:ABC-type polar amino acid transport system ATPase subunit